MNKLVQPTAGSVLIDGKDIANLDSVVLRRPIGYVMQEVGLLPRKSVLDNVTLTANIAGQTKDEALKNALELLELVGIDKSFHDRFPGQLSGGQHQT